MDNAFDIVEQLENEFHMFINTCETVSAVDLGLDSRAFYGHAWISDDAIIVDKDRARSLDYYGGFEYVDKESRTQIGNFVIYYDTDDRVKGCLATSRGEHLFDE